MIALVIRRLTAVPALKFLALLTSRHHSTERRKPAVAPTALRLAGPLFASLCLLFAAFGDQAQSPEVLVSNFATTGSYSAFVVSSQPFTTGTNAAGYRLTSVELYLFNNNQGDLLVRIIPSASDGTPDTSDSTQYIQLTNPPTFVGETANAFTAPADTTLAANTTYHVVIERPGLNAVRTNGQSSENPAAAGWSIGDSRYGAESFPPSSWSTNEHAIEIRVNGTIRMNNRPTAANKTVTTTEDTAYTFNANDFNFADVDTGDALDSVKIVTLPGAGSLTLDGMTVTANGSVSKANLDAAKLVFTPAANASGSPYTTFTFKVNDGDADSTASYTMTVNVTAANDPPTAANKTVTTAEDTAYSFNATDFGFADVDTDDELHSVKIVTLPALGFLANDGVAVTRNQSVSKVDLDDDKLVFTPAGNGDPYTSFTFTVNDGDADSAEAYTLTIDVTAANIPREQLIDPLEPANADVDWKARVTVGHWHVQNREWERGWRVQACAQRKDFTEVTDIEDHDPNDICFGRISDRDFTVGTETYTLEGIFHSVAHNNDSLTLAFTQEVDIAPLLNRTFVINGQSYAVTDRYYPQGNASRGPQIVWAEPTWTAARAF